MLNADHVKFRINTDEIEPWEFQAAFVSLHYIEKFPYHGEREFPLIGPVGESGTDQVWQLTDFRVKVAVLDNRTEDSVGMGIVDIVPPVVPPNLGNGNHARRDWWTGPLTGACSRALVLWCTLTTPAWIFFRSTNRYSVGSRGRLQDLAPVYDADPLISCVITRVCGVRKLLKKVIDDYTQGRILNEDW